MPSRILAMAALVTAATVLIPVSGSPAFPGANGPIAFVSNRDGNNEIYVVDPDGGDPQRLTANTQIDVDPAVSADGSNIAFARGVT